MFIALHTSKSKSVNFFKISTILDRLQASNMIIVMAKINVKNQTVKLQKYKVDDIIFGSLGAVIKSMARRINEIWMHNEIVDQMKSRAKKLAVKMAAFGW